MRVVRFLLAGVVLVAATAVHAAVASRANPIRRVVTMLQMMQEKVTAEGKREDELYQKFQCYCSSGGSDLAASIQAAEAKITADASALEASESQKTQLDQEIEKHKADRAEAEQALAEAKALREKEAAVFAKESSERTTNVAALGKAIAALERGAAGTGFLQTATAATLRQLSIDMDLGAVDREMLTAFLAGGDAEGYAPQSGQITGILKQMKDTMEKDLAEITATEQTAIQDFEALTEAKTKEMEAHGQAIESKTGRSGNLGLEIVALQESGEDTSKALEDDKKFLADLEKNCANF